MEDNESLRSLMDREFAKFMMLPSKTNGDELKLVTLHPLEQETREILNSYGIDWLMLEKSVENGPRSDVIGIYRIVISRLKDKVHQPNSLESNFMTPTNIYNFSNNGNVSSANDQLSNKTLLKTKKDTTKITCAIL